MWQWVARGNIQQISYIPQTEQHSPFGLMLLRLGNVTIVCVCVCVCIVMGGVEGEGMHSYRKRGGEASREICGDEGQICLLSGYL